MTINLATMVCSFIPKISKNLKQIKVQSLMYFLTPNLNQQLMLVATVLLHLQENLVIRKQVHILVTEMPTYNWKITTNLTFSCETTILELDEWVKTEKHILSLNR